LENKLKISEKQFHKRFDKDRYWDNDIETWFSTKVQNHKKDFNQWLKLFGK